MLASNYIPKGMTIHLQSENGVLGLVSVFRISSHSPVTVVIMQELFWASSDNLVNQLK